jgi:hypothetical protein
MNKLDPRVDSDRDHRAAPYSSGAHSNVMGAGTTTGHHTAGPHQSNLANKADPRVDSDRDHRAGLGGVGAGVGSHHLGNTGPAPTTAGPHKSDIMNKLDPRVDSDLDGSKTIGGNKTFSAPGAHHE